MKKSTLIAASLQRSGLLLLTAFFVIFFYTTLHECGHALAGWIFGGVVHQIDVNFFNLTAHAEIDGAFLRWQQALISLSGWALPVLAFLLFLLLGRNAREPISLALRWIGGVSLLGSTLAWVALPLVYLGGGRPMDDSINFLVISGLPPLLMALLFAAILAAGVWLAYRGRSQAFLLRDWLRAAEPPLANPATRRTLELIAVFTLALGIGLLAINDGEQTAGVPQDYQLVAQANLAQANPAGVTLCTFDRATQGPISIYLQAQGVRTDFVDVSLHGPDGWSAVILHGEGYSATHDRSHPTWGDMPAGHYDVVLSGAPARGEIAIYLKP